MKGIYGICIPLNLTGIFLSGDIELENYVKLKTKKPQIFTQRKNFFSCFPDAVKRLLMIDDSDYTIYSARLSNDYLDKYIEPTDERYCLVIGIPFEVENIEKDKLIEHMKEHYDIKNIFDKNDYFSLRLWSNSRDIHLIEVFPKKFNVITGLKN
jgi:hypothetical protein